MTKQQKPLFEDSGDAIFSKCRRYRYGLWRKLSMDNGKTILFIMLNPSTADEVINDPTVERCCRRALSLGFGKIAVCNIFSLRATDPRELYNSEINPVGIISVFNLNNLIIDAYSDVAEKIVLAWGNHGSLFNRGDKVIGLLEKKGHLDKCYHLGMTKEGQPTHPLYVSYNKELVKYEKKG